MSQTGWWKRSFILGLIALWGCGDGGKSIQPAKKVAETEPEILTIQAADAPEVSDPEAKTLLQAALAAHTEGMTERIQGMKSFTLVRSGPVRTPTRDIIQQTWTIQALWPQGYKLNAELGGNQVQVAVWGTTAKRSLVLGGQRTPVEVLKPNDADDFRLDTAGEWVWSLYPLTRPEVKVALYPPRTVQGKKLLGVRLFVPNWLPTVVFLNPDTKLIQMVAYQGRENNEVVYKEFLALEFKSFQGIQYPVRSVVIANGLQLAEWTVTKLEQAEHPASFFEQP